MMTKIQLQRLAKRLIGIREKDFSWGWLQRPDQQTIRKLSKKRANKFMLNCIIDYQKDTDQVWESARRLSEDVLRDPDSLWDVIGASSRSRWMARYQWLHWLSAARLRV